MLKISHKIFCFLKYFLYICKWIKDIRLMVNFSNFNSLHSVASYFSNEDKCKQAIIDENLFPNLTWADKPIEVEIIKK